MGLENIEKSITNRYPIFKPRLLASFARKMADEEDLVVIDGQPESQKRKKGPRKSESGWIPKLKLSTDVQFNSVKNFCDYSGFIHHQRGCILNEPGVVRRINIFNAIEPDICSKFRLSNLSKLASPFFFFLALWLFINNHEVLFVRHLCCKWREKPRPENRIAIRDWSPWPTWLASGCNFVGRAAKHCNIFSSSRIVGHNVWSKSNSIQHLIEQKMLDEHHPTWAAKRSNNVGSSKVGTLNPTLFHSLARA